MEKKPIEKIDLKDVESYVENQNQLIDNMPLSFLLGREMSGVLFYLWSSCVRSKVFRVLFTKLFEIACNHQDPEHGFPEFFEELSKVTTKQIFSSTELETYFHIKIPSNLKDLETKEDE